MFLFTLYSRSYCHLCDDMRDALLKFAENIPHQISVVDIDLNPELVEQYDELVPVLFARRANDDACAEPGRQLCHYFFDLENVKAFCDQ